MIKKFMKKYFPPTENAKRRRNIANFQENDRETLSNAWARFKRLVKNCPHNGFLKCVQMEIFYNGLNEASQTTANVVATGGLLDKTYIEVKDILGCISKNHED